MAEARTTTRSRIYVSYEPAIGEPHVSRLLEALGRRFDADRVVTMSRTEPFGPDEARSELHRLLDTCAVCLVLVDKLWVARRSQFAGSVEDLTRLEVSASLEQQDAVVIAVLLDDEALSRGAELPAELVPILQRQCFSLNDRDWDAGVAELLFTIAQAVEAAAREADSRERELQERYEERAQVAREEEQPGTAEAAPSLLAYDENVQFTVFRPASIQPERWYPLLAFAHLSQRRPDEPDEPDPIAEVQARAGRALGETLEDFRTVTQDSGYAVMREGELRLVPRMKGIVFNPPERRFLWTESVHQEDFRIRAQASMDGQIARGALSIFAGNLLLADVQLSIRVDRRISTAPQAQSEARPYRRIFASYSHLDTSIVQEFERHAHATGDTYLRDLVSLRSGEVWRDRLAELIGQADVFQLFWSWNALQSTLVRAEWQHALALNRPHFVRPVYWEEPFPERAGLPPEQLKRLHFQRVYPRDAWADIGAMPKMAGGAQGGVEVLPERTCEPTSTAAPPTAAPQRPRSLRIIRRGSIAAAVLLAVGLSFVMYETLSQPPINQSDMSSEAPPATSPPEPGSTDTDSAARPEPEPPAPRTEDRPAPSEARPRSAPPRPSRDSASGGSRPASPPPPDAAERPREMAPEFRRRVAVAIQSYEDALEAQDIDALRRVWRMSSRDARAIETLFRTSRTIDVRLQVLDVTATSDTRAVARAIETRTIVTSERETARRLRGEKVFYLERSGESWIIVDIISRSAARP